MIERTVEYEIQAANGDFTFSVERWFLPIDGPKESVCFVALVLDDKVVLCHRRKALEICAAITSVAQTLE